MNQMEGSLEELNHRVWISELSFSDGSSLQLKSDDIIVIVGPNNSGKSEALRGINQKLTNPLIQNPVIRELKSEMQGESTYLIDWLSAHSHFVNEPIQNPQYQVYGASVQRNQAVSIWSNPQNGFQALAPFFCRLLNAENRIGAGNPANNIALGQDPPNHPIHYLQQDDDLEQNISKQFKKAFDQDLIVHHKAGNIVPLHVGKRPVLPPEKDRASVEYANMLRLLPELQQQGDGMRSFAGVLLHTSVGQESIFLLDEPEAFLHPPQARLLGRMLVEEKQVNRQLFIATHSGDVLKGILDSGSKNVCVVRLRREGDVNVMRQLANERIAELWGDPLLRYSDILDGLFHEKVIITEGDSDARFYAALMDSQAEANTGNERYPSVMYTHCGGKGRLPLVAGALNAVEVPVIVVPDFDVLNDENTLSKLVESLGGTWSEMVAEWKQVRNAVESKKPETGGIEIKTKIEEALKAAIEPIFSASIAREIRAILKTSSPWSTAKGIGKQFIPSGQPTQLYDELQAKLEAIGIFVVPVGELESFCKKYGGHGPAWVNEVLKLPLASDPDLQSARDFVGKVVDWKKTVQTNEIPSLGK